MIQSDVQQAATIWGIKHSKKGSMSLTSLTLDDGLNCAFRFCRTMKRYEEEFRGVRVFARAHTHTYTPVLVLWSIMGPWFIYIYILFIRVSYSFKICSSCRFRRSCFFFFYVFATIHFWFFFGVPKFQHHVHMCVRFRIVHYHTGFICNILEAIMILSLWFQVLSQTSSDTYQDHIIKYIGSHNIGCILVAYQVHVYQSHPTMVPSWQRFDKSQSPSDGRWDGQQIVVPRCFAAVHCIMFIYMLYDLYEMCIYIYMIWFIINMII